MPTTPADPQSLFFNTDVPNSARIFDYLVGGTANFEVDRAAAAKLIHIWPSLPKVTRLRRAFVQEAAQVLYDEGFRQFLDLASGLPTNDHLHAVLPEARVIYSDINPVAITYGESYLAHLEHVAYIYGNAAQVDDIIHHETVRRLFAPDEKVAIGLNALTIFLPQTTIETMAQKLYAWAAPGSVIFVAFQSRLGKVITDEYLQVVNIFAQAGMPIWLYTTDEVKAMLAPWYLERFAPLVTFLGLPEDFLRPQELELPDMEINAAIFRKL
ncbi:MAG: SAM-dependent methyltransferase [Chloroflexi bacterium]|nr:SAM-dependent methyltransferase [Chloroflexota bacterium]MBP8058776.1 SAM-dependent methyltransferase [Chloroflexota bacterium]